MSAAELVVVLGAVATVLTALGGVIVQLRRLEIRVDGRLTQLLELTAASSKAEGVKQEKESTNGSAAESETRHSDPDRPHGNEPNTSSMLGRPNVD